MKKIILFGLMLCILENINAQTMNQHPSLGKDKIENVIAAMTLEDKVYLLIGLGDNLKNPVSTVPCIILEGEAGRTWDIPRFGITATVLTDGPAGLRITAHPKDMKTTRFCTAFPTATALSSTWNTELVENVGQAMGNEVLEYGSDVLLAPAINIHRNPLCGRNFEYYSEDPLIAGKIGAAMVKGIQSNNVGTSLKHFAANNIETNRGEINAVISQRALREIYLRGFEIVIKESQPWTVMSSYNRLNGFYTSENYDLLTTILRDEWHFKGLVMSDWGGGKDAVAQMNAGNDLLMHGTNYQRKELLYALKNKLIDEKTLDRNLARMLSFILKTPRFKAYPFTEKPDLTAHALTARNAASESMVLLKNEKNTLPLTKIKTVALFGKTSYDFITGGTGSGEVNNKHSVSPEEGITNNGFKVSGSLQAIYKNIIDTILENKKKNLIDNQEGIIIDKLKYTVSFHNEVQIDKVEIAKQAAKSDIAIITIGRNSGEGWDRSEKDYFNLIPTEHELIQNVTECYHAVNKKVVVVLNIGGVIETASWKNIPDAILLAWQTGQEGGNALADVLNGKVSPSGKLPMSFPMKYADVPSAKTFPGEPANNPVNAVYSEGIYVGYRYYDTFKIPTSYEFGYGLSYTQFEYSNLQFSSNVFGDGLTAKVVVKNTGKREGKEVVQLYLHAPNVEIAKPEQELKAFVKTKSLKPGESQEISFTLDTRSLASFWTNISSWVAEKGTYEIRMGSSSKDIQLKSTFELPETKVVEKLHNVLYPNRAVTDLTAPGK